MRWAANAFLVLSVCAGCAVAGPISTSATADMSFNGQIFHSAQQGTSFAGASVPPIAESSASGSASVTGLTLDAHTFSFYSYRHSGSGYARSTGEAVLDDFLYILAPYGHVEMDLVVNNAQVTKGGQTGVEVWVNDDYTSWQYPYPQLLSFPLTITADGSGGPYYRGFSIRTRVWASSDADGIGNAIGWSNVTIQSIRAYDLSSHQMTGLTYRSDSGMSYPFEGATYDGVPEPGTVTLLIAGGVLAVISKFISGR